MVGGRRLRGNGDAWNQSCLEPPPGLSSRVPWTRTQGWSGRKCRAQASVPQLPTRGMFTGRRGWRQRQKREKSLDVMGPIAAAWQGQRSWQKAQEPHARSRPSGSISSGSWAWAGTIEPMNKRRAVTSLGFSAPPWPKWIHCGCL